MMKQVLDTHVVNKETVGARLNVMEAQHRELDERVRELGRHVYLTPAEQYEMIELKKRKLKTKDEIMALRRALTA